MIIGISMLVALAAVVIFILISKKYKLLLDPCFLFVSEWIIIIALSNFGLFGLYTPSANSYFIIVLGIVSFVIGYCILSRLKLKTKMKSKQKNFSIRYGLLYTLGAICIIYFAFSAVDSLSNLINGSTSFNDVRILAQTREDASVLVKFIYNFIVLPALYVLEIVTVADIFRGKRDKRLIAITVGSIVLKTISDGSRNLILNFIIYLFIAYQLSKRKNNKDKKDKPKNRAFWRLILIVATLAVLFFIVTIQRSPSGVFRMSYLYFSMPPVMLDWWSNFVDSSAGHWFGLVCLNGVLFAINYIIKNLFGFAEYPSFVKKPYDLISETDSQWISINNNGTKANAYVTMFWFFYADFGYVGVAVGCLLYGLLVRKIYNYELTKSDARSLSFYLLIFWTLLYSFVRFQFAKSPIVIATVILYLSFKKEEKLENGNE